MFIEKIIRINDDYLITKTNTPDSNTIKVRALETETLQTKPIQFYLLDNNLQVVQLSGFDETGINDLKSFINEVLLEEIYKGNHFFIEYGIDVQLVLEILFLHEDSVMNEVPSITTYPDFIERETLDYLRYSESISSESIERIMFINHGIVTLKDSPLWSAFDIITILAQSSNWNPLNLNRNLKIDLPKAWLNSYPGKGGGLIADRGLRLSGLVVDVDQFENMGFINLGYQPRANDFSKYFPLLQYFPDNCSITIKIDDWRVGTSGIIYRFGQYQDILMYDATNEIININISGNDNIGYIYQIPFTDNPNGIWTINRTSYSVFELWKDGLLIYQNTNSDVFNNAQFETYGSLGYGVYGVALDCIYQIATLGRSLIAEEIGPFHNFLNEYINALPSNDIELVHPIVIEEFG